MAVIGDVEKYPTFVPWVKKANILQNDKIALEVSKDNEKILNKFLAELEVGFLNVNTKYTSIVTIESNAVKATAVEDDLFKFLETTWQCIPDPIKGTNIVFNLSFRFKSLLHDGLAQKFFPNASKAMVDAFVNRCHLLYKNK